VPDKFNNEDLINKTKDALKEMCRKNGQLETGEEKNEEK